MILLKEASFAGQAFDYAQAFEFGIGLRNGVTVETKLFGKRTDGGKRLAGLQLAGGGSGLDLINELEIDGHAGFEVDLKEQGVGLLS